jgi:hypothetical protein
VRVSGSDFSKYCLQLLCPWSFDQGYWICKWEIAKFFSLLKLFVVFVYGYLHTLVLQYLSPNISILFLSTSPTSISLTSPSATIPPRIMTQRTIACSTSFTAFLSMGLYAHIYFLPFYFQAVKSTTAEGSGIRTIPYLVSTTIASIIIGASITTFGRYTPFMWFGSAVFTIGAGMLYTLQVDSGPGKWIGFQILAGLGAGASIQIPFIAVQVVLSAKDMPTGSTPPFSFPSSSNPDIDLVHRRPSHILQLPRRRPIHLHRRKRLHQYPHLFPHHPGAKAEPCNYHCSRSHSCG